MSPRDERALALAEVRRRECMADAWMAGAREVGLTGDLDAEITHVDKALGEITSALTILRRLRREEAGS